MANLEAQVADVVFSASYLVSHWSIPFCDQVSDFEEFLGGEEDQMAAAEAMMATMASQSQRLEHMQANLPAQLPHASPNPLSEVNLNDPSKGTAKKPKKKGTKTIIVPTLAYVRVDEFDSIPKYMKGR
jgi:hypothetical protein